MSQRKSVVKKAHNVDFVLEKSIFSNIFEKDIRRVFIYKKAERLAKAVCLISPAFMDNVSFKNRMEAIAVGLVDAAALPLSGAKEKLSRELLALSSALSVAQTGGLLSVMNAELIAREAQDLLREVANYEEPMLAIDEPPTLAEIAKVVPKQKKFLSTGATLSNVSFTPKADSQTGEEIIKDKIKDRRNAIMSVIKDKGHVTIKDISTALPHISEKTIQRELSFFIENGMILKKGERRWSTYALAGETGGTFSPVL